MSRPMLPKLESFRNLNANQSISAGNCYGSPQMQLKRCPCQCLAGWLAGWLLLLLSAGARMLIQIIKHKASLNAHNGSIKTHSARIHCGLRQTIDFVLCSVFSDARLSLRVVRLRVAFYAYSPFPSWPWPLCRRYQIG